MTLPSKIYALAKMAVPILDQSNFKQIFGGKDGKSLPLDEQHLLRNIQTVAFPGTKFTVQEIIDDYIYKVTTEEYPETPLYVDQRFLQLCLVEPMERERVMPRLTEVVEHLEKSLGTPYVWGGNWMQGIPQMKQWYPPSVSFESLDPHVQRHWIMEGVDCSGLLFQATQGCTPRNTSQLIAYGAPIFIQNMGLEKIASQLKILDLIVWRGHVIIVFKEDTLIESIKDRGVVSSQLHTRLEELLKEKKAVNSLDDYPGSKNHFVVRRWHPEVVSTRSTLFS